MDDPFRYRQSLFYGYSIEEVNDDYCFAPILRNLNVESGLPFRMTPSLEIRPATDVEVSIISDGLRNFRGDRYLQTLSSHFRTDVPPYTNPPPKDFNVVSRTEFVASPMLETPDVQDFLNLETASRLSEFDLPIGQVFFTCGAKHFPPGFRSKHILFVGYDPTNYMASDRMRRIIQSANITTNYLNEVQEILGFVSKLRAAASKCSPNRKLSGALNIFDGAIDLGLFNPMFVVSLMSLIERLVIRKKGGTNLNISIKQEMPVRGSQFRRPLDYDRFSPATPEKVWDALYELRSCLAHGREIDFSRNKLSPLKGKELACEFLLEAATGLVLDEIERIVPTLPK